MFTGTIRNWDEEKRFLPAAFTRALDFFFEHGCDLPLGSHDIEGRAIYVNVEDGLTKPASERRFEVHGRYIDVQLLLTGSERQDYTTGPVEGTPDEDFMEERDIAFYPEPANVQTLVMEPGRYAVFFPGELHAPNLAVGNPAQHRKAVFKIRADLARSS